MSTWRGDFKQIEEAHATIVGISTDQTYAQRVFKASLGGLPYELVSDWMRHVSQAYGVLEEKGGYAKRTVFVVGQDHELVYQDLAFKPGDDASYAAVIKALAR